ncbi:MAG: tetratricopeptide repeat protein, partial [Ruminococcus sp.]|nr:tetratricopeptide repeat protein [Ruminococcus sp.]
FRECVTLRKQLLPTGDAAELRYGIYSSLYNLGRIAERQERYGEAADCYRKSLGYLAPDNADDLADTQSRLDCVLEKLNGAAETP